MAAGEEAGCVADDIGPRVRSALTTMSLRELPQLTVEAPGEGKARPYSPSSPGSNRNVKASVSATNEAQGFVGLYNFKGVCVW